MPNAIEEMWNGFKTNMYTKATNGLGHPKVKIWTGSRNMRKRSSHCLLRNRRFKCKMWHVTCNQTKMAFLPVRPAAQEKILQMNNILWPNVHNNNNDNGIDNNLQALRGPTWCDYIYLYLSTPINSLITIY